MSVETATYISDLNTSYPASGDPKSEGDNHLRLIKQVVKTTFPNVAGAVTPTHTELNFVDGVTSSIQTQLDAKASLASPAFTGTPTVPTATPGTNTTQAASTAFVQAAAFASSLPSQTGNAGKFVTTDGTNASWGTAGDVLIGTAQTLTAPKRGTVTTDNDASLDLSVTNNFSVTPTGSATLTFTNIGSASGQSGFIKLVNGSNYTISAAATTKISTTDLAQVSQTGTYICSYFCDGTNVYVVSSRSLA